MKKFLVVSVSVVVILAVFSLPTVSLQKKDYRSYKPVELSQSHKDKIKDETVNLTEYKIIKYSNERTRELLKFGKTCETFDDSKVTRMHCVGYARVCATICNYAFSVNNIKGSAKPVVGYVLWNNKNLNRFSKMLPEEYQDFFKDHDFVEVKYENRTIYVDPTLDLIYEYL